MLRFIYVEMHLVGKAPKVIYLFVRLGSENYFYIRFREKNEVGT